MIAADSPPSSMRARRGPLIVAGLLLVIELMAIGLIFKHSISFNCLENWPPRACANASGTLVALYCMLAGLFLFSMLRPASLGILFSHAGDRIWPLGINLLGVLVALIPVSFLQDGAGTEVIVPAFVFWSLGMGLLLTGLALYLATHLRWHRFLKEYGLTLIPMLVAAAAAPTLAIQIRPLWHNLDAISQITFDAVAFVVRALGYQVDTPPGTKVIGSGDFYINVAPQCSGIEGFVLVTVFVSLYLLLFRADLRFPWALILFPAGLAASAAFNVLRIAILLIIGLEGNPELAVGGFHSHAGWLMFTLVALGIIALAQTFPAFQKAGSQSQTYGNAPQAQPAFLDDPIVAHILPFVVFMFSALLAQVFSNSPGVVYPLRVLAMAAALILFLQVYRRLSWHVDGVAFAAGLAIGIMWVVIPVPPSDAAPYGSLTGGLLLGWFVLRGIGTIVLVPVIEELFFRGYLENRLRLGTGAGWRVLAAVITAALFAALHDRWAEAFAAGLIFSWVMSRRGSVVDAILAHAAANALVYSVALITGNLAII
ncbi:hypothetical protein ROLI_029410 [Roseobacter fucihabitans]|uniref:CAAX prenyl protease 2/Lysostaphin resistance protein A-like domain-containing protein n=2 Tax=Roseobacter fucihabitans TaxID=1537242 RepID=A0ABZ2BUV5_9RHOB|nr:Transmembrane exosortase [Roseobacter litoralis]